MRTQHPIKDNLKSGMLWQRYIETEIKKEPQSNFAWGFCVVVGLCYLRFERADNQLCAFSSQYLQR